jgi:hypothetical protein
MRVVTAALGALVASVLLLWPAAAGAATTRPMNLEERTHQAERIFLGTGLSVSPGTARVASAELPTVTYRVRVEALLKGSVEEAEGVVDVRMLDGSGTRPVSSRDRVIVPGAAGAATGPPLPAPDDAPEPLAGSRRA